MNRTARKFLVLSLTDRCNLACVYCYEHQKSKNRLSVGAAKQAISHAFRDDTYAELEINFFGGEPLLEFRKLRYICEWLWGSVQPRPYICSATTNGTLVHGEIGDWFRKNHKRFVLALSLDGTEEMHNRNRTGSFGRIDTSLFRELWPFQPVKMTVSKETLADLADGVIYLHRQGFGVNCNLAHGLEWAESDTEILSRELKKLVAYYLENPSLQPSSIVTMDITPLSQYKGIARPYCGAGTAISCIGPDGDAYPCQTFMPCSTGKATGGEAMFAALKSNEKRDGRCEPCSLFPICPTCYGMNYVQNGDPFARRLDQCLLQKVRAKASAYLMSEMLIHRDRDYAYIRGWSDAEIRSAITSIRLVNESIVV